VGQPVRIAASQAARSARMADGVKYSCRKRPSGANRVSDLARLMVIVAERSTPVQSYLRDGKRPLSRLESETRNRRSANGWIGKLAGFESRGWNQKVRAAQSLRVDRHPFCRIYCQRQGNNIKGRSSGSTTFSVAEKKSPGTGRPDWYRPGQSGRPHPRNHRRALRFVWRFSGDA
jgi:hypothetical protein